MGYYVEAMLAIDDCADEYKELASEVLQALIRLDTGGFNTIPEVFDGDAPHRPGGCISQAWSVAEVIRGGLFSKSRNLEIDILDFSNIIRDFEVFYLMRPGQNQIKARQDGKTRFEVIRNLANSKDMARQHLIDDHLFLSKHLTISGQLQR
jgi:Amylo-alpha-1,6-glucosidase